MAITPATHKVEHDDVNTVAVTASAAAPPAAVWWVLCEQTAEWWSAPYLGPADPPMRMQPRLGGAVWSGSSDGPDSGARHGTIRAFDPPERLEIGGVLVPGTYAGSITITVEGTALGSQIRVEQLCRGRLSASVEERISTGWTQLLARLVALVDD